MPPGSYERTRHRFRPFWRAHAASASGDYRRVVDAAREFTTKFEAPRAARRRRAVQQGPMAHLDLRPCRFRVCAGRPRDGRARHPALARVAPRTPALSVEADERRETANQQAIAALVLARRNRHDEAIALITPALKFQRELAARGRDDPGQRVELANALSSPQPWASATGRPSSRRPRRSSTSCRRISTREDDRHPARAHRRRRCPATSGLAGSRRGGPRGETAASYADRARPAPPPRSAGTSSAARRGTPATRSARRSRSIRATPSFSTGARFPTRAPAREHGPRAARSGPGGGSRPARLADILSLRGRLWKDGFHRAKYFGAAHRAGRARAREYLAAYRLLEDPFPGSMRRRCRCCWATAQRRRALAPEIAADRRTDDAAHVLGPGHGRGGRAAAAAIRPGPTSLLRRVCRGPGDAGSVASMRRQVGLIARVLPEAADVLLLLPAPAVAGVLRPHDRRAGPAGAPFPGRAGPR